MAESVIYSVNSNNTVYVDATPVTLSLNINCISASATHTLAIKNGSTTLVTLSLGSYPMGSSTQTVSLTAPQRAAILNSIPNVASFTATYVLSTTLNNVSQGTSSCTGTMAVSPNTSAPDTNAFTYADTNAKTVAFTGDNQCVVPGYSNIVLYNVSATAYNGASIDRYVVTEDIYHRYVTFTSGGTINLGTIPRPLALDDPTQHWITVQAIDTRNFSSQSHKEIPYVYMYNPLTVSSATLKRNSSDPSEIDISFSGTYTNKAQNAVTASYKFKETTASTYGADNAITVTTSGSNFSCSLTGVGSFAETTAYNVILTISDKITDRTYNFTLAKQNPLIAFRDEAIGIGDVPTGTKSVEIASGWSIVDHGNITVDGKNSTFSYEPYSFGTTGQASTTGWARIARVKLNNATQEVIHFHGMRRVDVSTFDLYLEMNGSYEVAGFYGVFPKTASGTSFDAFVQTLSNNTYDVYVRKVSSTDYITVWTYAGLYTQGGTRCDITYADALVSSVPDGAIKVKPVPCLSYSNVTFTKTSGDGNITSASIRKMGNVCQLTMTLQMANTNAGSNLLEGSFSGAFFPVQSATAVTYYGSSVLVGFFSSSTSHTFTVRVFAAPVTSTTGTSTLTLIYLTNE